MYIATFECDKKEKGKISGIFDNRFGVFDNKKKLNRKYTTIKNFLSGSKKKYIVGHISYKKQIKINKEFIYQDVNYLLTKQNNDMDWFKNEVPSDNNYLLFFLDSYEEECVECIQLVKNKYMKYEPILISIEDLKEHFPDILWSEILFNYEESDQ